MIRMHEGKPDAALAELDRAIALFPSDPARLERATVALHLARARRAAGQDVAPLLRLAREDLAIAAKNRDLEALARPHLEDLRRLEAP